MSGDGDVRKKDVPVTLAMPQAEVDAVDAWMDAHRVRSRSAAVRTMIRFALARGAVPDDEPDLRRKENRRERGRSSDR